MSNCPRRKLATKEEGKEPTKPSANSGLTSCLVEGGGRGRMTDAAKPRHTITSSFPVSAATAAIAAAALKT